MEGAIRMTQSQMSIRKQKSSYPSKFREQAVSITNYKAAKIRLLENYSNTLCCRCSDRHKILLQSQHLTVTLETHRVSVEPGSTIGSSLDAIGSVSTLAKSTSLASGRSKPTTFTVLVYRVDNPVDARIVANLCV